MGSLGCVVSGCCARQCRCPAGGQARQAGSQLRAHQGLRQAGAAQGPSPLATTMSTATGAPVIAGIRLRAGKAGSGPGAASVVTEAVNLARAAGATQKILVRGDSADGTGAVVASCLKAQVQFSVVVTKNASVVAAIAAIPEDAWIPAQYPGRGPRPRQRRVDLRRRGRRDRVHFVRLHHTAGHRPAGRAAGPDQAKLDELFPPGGTTRS